MTDNPDNPVSPPLAGISRRVIVALALGMVVLLTVAVAGWLTASRSGFASLWQAVAWASGRSVVVDQVEGTLWQGFNLKGLHYRDRSRQVDIEHLRLNWQPIALWQRQLLVQELDIGLVQLRTPTNAPAFAWPRLPQNLHLPLKVNVQRLRIAGISIEPQPWQFYQLDGRYLYDGSQHQLTLRTLRTPDAELTGEFSVAAKRPFALHGRADLQAAAGQGALAASGSLMQLRLQGVMRSRALRVDLDGRFAPFDPQPFQRIRQLNLETSGLDPHQLLATWPHAALDISARIEPDTTAGARSEIKLLNRQPGAWSAQRLPLTALQAQLHSDGDRLNVVMLKAQVAQGQLTLTGMLSARRLLLDATVHNMALQGVHINAPPDVVSGHAELRGSLDTPELQAWLKGRYLKAEAQLSLMRAASGASIQLRRLLLAAGPGQLSLHGILDSKHRFRLQGTLQHADPSRVHASWPKGDINALFEGHGQLGSGAGGELTLAFTPSRLSGAPLDGRLDLGWSGQRLTKTSAELNLAGNRIQARGAYGALGDRIEMRVQAPVLSALGFGFSGALNGHIILAGTPGSPQFSIQLDARTLQLPGVISAKSLRLASDLQAGDNTPFQLQLSGEQLRVADWQIDSVKVSARGSRAQHTIDVESRQQLAAHPSHLVLQARGGWAVAGWQGALLQARLSGQLALQLLTPLRLELGREHQLLGAGRMMLAGGEVQFGGIGRDANGAINSQGQMTHLNLAQLQPWLQLPFSQNLVADGAWSLHPDGRGSLTLRRVAGDILLPAAAGNVPMTLRAAAVVMDWDRNQSRIGLTLASKLGSLSGQAVLAAAPLRIVMATPLSGQLHARLPDLATFISASGSPAMASGELALDLQLAGSLAHPAAHGVIHGSRLAWQDRDRGVHLSGGELSARLEGQQLLLDQLHFANANNGELRAHGRIGFASKQPTADVQVEISRFRVFDQPDRRLVVSGKGSLSVSERQIHLGGRVRADQGGFSLQRDSTPALSADVVVRGRVVADSSPFGHLPLAVDLVLDLGDHFSIRGEGLKVDLAGQVDLRSRSGSTPSAYGQVRVVKGNYQAYGQELDIESGTITFVGPVANPNLDVRARRHLSTVGAGVEVQGTVAAPKLQLIADQSLSERDKLSWLVLGHAASDNPQDSNFLALAASSMAAGRLNRQVGLFDDLGLVERESRTALNGTVSPAEQVLTVGKQLTRTFYLGYEYGLTSSQQAVKLIYQLSSKWSVVLRAGADASLESRYTLRFD